ncbi:DUF6531 domain-containing protein, partial [Paenibacillus popilliae]
MQTRACVQGIFIGLCISLLAGVFSSLEITALAPATVYADKVERSASDESDEVADVGWMAEGDLAHGAKPSSIDFANASRVKLTAGELTKLTYMDMDAHDSVYLKVDLTKGVAVSFQATGAAGLEMYTSNGTRVASSATNWLIYTAEDTDTYYLKALAGDSEAAIVLRISQAIIAPGTLNYTGSEDFAYFATNVKADRTMVFETNANGGLVKLYNAPDKDSSWGGAIASSSSSRLSYTAAAEGLYYLYVEKGTTLRAADGSDFAHAYPATFTEGELTKTDSYTVPARESAYFKVDLTGGVPVRFQTTGATGLAIYDQEGARLGSSDTDSLLYTAEDTGTYYLQAFAGDHKTAITVWTSQVFTPPGTLDYTRRYVYAYFTTNVKADRTMVFKTDYQYSTFKLYNAPSTSQDNKIASNSGDLWYTASADGLYYLEVGEGTTLHAADGSDMAHAYPATFSEGKLTKTDTCTIPAKESAYFKVDVPGGVAVRFQATDAVGLEMYSSSGTKLASSATDSLLSTVKATGTYYIKAVAGSHKAQIRLWTSKVFTPPGAIDYSRSGGESAYFTTHLKADRTMIFQTNINSFPRVELYSAPDKAYSWDRAIASSSKTALFYSASAESVLRYTPSASGLYYLRVSGGTILYAADGSDIAHAYPATITEGKLTKTETYTVPAKESAYFKVDVTAGIPIRFQTTGAMGLEIYNKAGARLASSATDSLLYTAKATGTYYLKALAGNRKALITLWTSQAFKAPGVLNYTRSTGSDAYFTINLKADRTMVFKTNGKFCWLNLYNAPDKVSSHDSAVASSAYSWSSKLLYTPSAAGLYYLRELGEGTTVHAVDGSDTAHAYPATFTEGELTKTDIYTVPAFESAYFKVDVTEGVPVSFQAAGAVGLEMYTSNGSRVASSHTDSLTYTTEVTGTYYLKALAGNRKATIALWTAQALLAPGALDYPGSGGTIFATNLKADRTMVFTTNYNYSSMKLFTAPDKASAGDSEITSNYKSDLVHTPSAAGLYYLEVGGGTTLCAVDGSDIAHAYPANVNTTVEYSVPAGESAYYQVSLEGGTDYTIAARSGSGITLYDANGTGLGTTDRTVLDYRAPDAGTYYIQVAHNGSQPTTIGLNVYETWLLDQTGTIGYSGTTDLRGYLVQDQNYSITLIGGRSLSLFKSGTFTAVDSTSSWNRLTYTPSASGLYTITVYGEPGEEFRISTSGMLSGMLAYKQIAKFDPSAVDPQSLVQDPIDTSTGAHVITLSKLGQQSAFPFDLTLQYHSLLLGAGPLGKGWSHNYEAQLVQHGDQVVVHWGANRHNTFWPTGEGKYISTESAAQQDTLVRQEDGRFTYTRKKDQTVYQFDAAGKLTEQHHAHGHTLRFAYHGDGTLATVTNRITNQRLHFAYDEQQQLRKVTDDLQREVAFHVDSNGHLIGIADENGQAVAYTYDDAGRVLTGTNGEGVQMFADTYDTAGRVVKQVDAVGGSSHFRYDEETQPGHLITTVTDREGHVSTLIHDNQYRVLQKTDEVGGSTRFTYDASGNRLTRVDANHETSKMTYDEAGNLTRVQDPAGNVLQMTYDDRHNVLTATDPTGRQVVNTYDANNNLLRTTDTDGHETSYTYDSNSLVHTKTTANGGVTRYQYTDGQLTAVTDPEGNLTTFTYDAAGHLIETTDPLGGVTRLTYDAKGNVTQITDALGHITTMTYNSHGDIVSRTDALGNTTKYTYNGNGKLTERQDALGHLTRYAYSGEDRLVTVTDALGQSTRQVYDAKGRRIQTVDALGNRTTFSYDPLDQLLTKISPEGNSMSMIYNAVGQVIQTTDGMGQSSHKSYDKLGRMLERTDPLGGRTTWTYNGRGEVLSHTDAVGGSLIYTYDALGDVQTVTDAAGNTKSFTYNKNGKLTAVSDKVHGTITHRYDANSRLIETIDALGGSQQFAYDAKNRLIQITDAAGGITRFEYDALDRLIRETDAQGHSQTYRYDALGRMTHAIDAGGYETRKTYDAVGNLLTVTDPLGQVVTYTYNAAGQVLTETDANGNVTAFTYNKNGLLTHKTDALGHITAYAYDNENRLTQITNPLGHTVHYRYDALGRLIETIDALGHTNRSVYDPVGNVQQTIDAEGVVTAQATYDKAGNPVTITDALGATTTMQYDAGNRLTRVTDARGNTHTYAYDVLDRLAAATDPLAGTSKQHYDAFGKLTSYTDANGHTTRYAYDSRQQQIGETFGSTSSLRSLVDSRPWPNITSVTDSVYGSANHRRMAALGPQYGYNDTGNLLTVTGATYGSTLTSYTDLNGDTTSGAYASRHLGMSGTLGDPSHLRYSYNSRQLLSSMVNARGDQFTYEYDAAGRLHQVSDAEGQLIYTYEYDANGNVTSVTDSVYGSKQRTYDRLNRVLTSTDTRGHTIGYTYDAAGNITKLTYPDGKEVSYTYNANGELLTVTDWAGRRTRYTYDANHRLVTTTRADGSVETRTYDAAGQLTVLRDAAADGTVWVQDDFTYDMVGNVTQEGANRYQYDANHRLMEAAGRQYGYDAAGNLLTVTGATYAPMAYGSGNPLLMSDGQPITVTGATYALMTYGSNNQLLTFNGQTIMYDADGNMVLGPLNGQFSTYRYDANNRLIQAGDVYYTYDADHVRRSMTSPAGTTYFVTNEESMLSQLLMEV